MRGFVVGMIITGVCGLFFAALGVYMARTGRGSSLIAGYNTMSKTDREKYDAAALSRFIGGAILVPVGLATALFAAGLYFARESVALLWAVVIGYSAVVLGLCVFSVVWCNTGGRFRK